MNIIFDPETIHSISAILATYTTGSRITNILINLKLSDLNQYSQSSSFGILHSKSDRLKHSIIDYQNRRQSGLVLIQIIEWIFNPVNFIDKEHNNWSTGRNDINQILQFSGLFLNDNGKIVKTNKVKSYTEGRKRYHSLKSQLTSLDIHARLLSACRPEILQDNYFHLIFESSKIVLTKVREISEINLDGNKLINQCFNIKKPIIVLNTLQNESERSMYWGLKSLLHEIVYLYRNPKAHEPKAYSETSEVDAIYALVTMSRALNILDKCSKNYLN